MHSCHTELGIFSILYFSKSRDSSKSATFDEWLEDKKSKKQQQQKKEKEARQRKEMELESKRQSRMAGKSFEDWKNSKSRQKQELPGIEKRRDDIVREEPGRQYSLTFERWLSKTGTLDLHSLSS